MSGNGTGAFAAIVQKELRENFKWAILLLLILSVVLTTDLQRMTRMGEFYEIDITSMFTTTSILTAVIGLLIGLAQVVLENRGDKWGFLTHRPVSRSTLFWGKAVAGIVLYAAAVALPWIGSLVWIAIPGHLPLPFDARMALPGTADLLCGIVYYFAGLLTGMREARWYASRAMGIGIGIVCSIASLAAGSFWLAVAFIAGGVIINCAAAWGAFVGGGHYETQPRRTRFATGIAVASGLLIVCVAVSAIIASVVPGVNSDLPSTRYTVDSDGSIVRMVNEGGLIVDIQDQQGRPIEKYKDPAVRDKSSNGVVERDMGISSMRFGVVPNRYRWTGDFFKTLNTDDTNSADGSLRWYYVMREGLIAAYDNKTAKLSGWMGPGGFAAGVVPPAQRFDHPLLNKSASRQPLIAFEDAVYRVDIGQRRIEKIFTPSAGESVLGAEGASRSGYSAIVSDDPAVYFDIVATTQRVIVQSHSGAVQLSVPFDPQAVGYDQVSVYRVRYAPDMPTFVWYSPFGMNRPEPSPQLVTKFDAGNKVVARYSLPPLETSASMPWSAAPVFLAVPVTVRAALAKTWRSENLKIDLSAGMSPSQRTATWFLTGFASLATAAAIFVRGRKYAFAGGRTWMWTAIGFILGPFGYLLMLVLLEWPALEKCPSCGRMRVVTHEHCEHCSKPFAPPQADGTEVFEAI